MVLRFVSRVLEKQTNDVVRLLPSADEHEVSINDIYDSLPLF
jgi:hypothetical protein